MRHILFLGNGINRCSPKNAYSWQDLLNELQGELEVSTNTKKDLPFSFYYEEIYLRNRQTFNVSEEALLKRVQETIKKMSHNSIHSLFRNLKVDGYITTNYDYLIETSLSDTFEKHVTFGEGEEIKYRIRTYHEANDKEVWHIHGDVESTKTIVLGHKMYSDVVRSISSYIEKDLDNKDKKSWIDSFFEDEISILGYGMSYTDITVWYVLNERARRIAEGTLKRNHITFYMHDTQDQKEALTSLLEAHYIDVVVSKEKESFEGFYTRVLGEINDR